MISLQGADGSEAGSAMSGADGAFSIADVANGAYTATVSLDGFQSASQAVNVTASGGHGRLRDPSGLSRCSHGHG